MKRAVLGVGLVFAAACVASRPSELEPRYVAVHNTLAAMGMAEVGPLHRGSLAEGRESRIALDLGADCTTLVAIGSGNVQDLGVEVLDADNKLVVKDATNDAEAAVKVCPPSAGRFTLVVKMVRGAGDFTVATWTGGATAPSASAALKQPEGDGTCESPIPLAAGTVAGSTQKGHAENASQTCGPAEGKEVIYRLELAKEQRVTLDVDATFDSIIYVRHDDCNDQTAELACNDDANVGQGKKPVNLHASHIEDVFPAGAYYVFVDSYSEAGTYRLTTELTDVPTLAEACSHALTMNGFSMRGNLSTSAFNAVEGTCGDGKGPEVPLTFSLPRKARARIVLQSTEFHPVAHLRKTCTDEATEVACTDSAANSNANEATIVELLEPGTYTLFADSTEPGAHGKFQVDTDLATPDGVGIASDSCADARTLPLSDQPTVVAYDTFDAKDDFNGTCTAPGAPDVMYRFQVATKSRVTARFVSEEGAHVFVLSASCTDRSTEIACAAQLDEVLAPGTYWLAVDGTARGPFGRFQLSLQAKDVSAQDSACKAAPAIALGQTVTGTTIGAGDHFTVSCGGRLDAQASGDRVYKLTLPAKQHVQLLLTTPNHDGVLAVRRACQDPPRMKSLRDVEAMCNNDAPDTRHSKLDATLDAGTYYVVVDGHQGKNEGTYTLKVERQ